MNKEKGKNDQTKQVIDQIALKGLDINKHLISINQANKIIKAQALAERYVDKINTLIVLAKSSGLLDVASQFLLVHESQVGVERQLFETNRSSKYH